MAKKRKYKRRKSYKKKSKKGLSSTLVTALFVLAGIFLLFSYTQSGSFAIEANKYLIALFGGLAFLIPINLILLGLYLGKLNTRITQANVVIGFIVLTTSLVGFLNSGIAGQNLAEKSTSLLGNILTNIIFFAGIAVGLIVMLNLTISQVIETIVNAIKKILSTLKNVFVPMLKTKDRLSVKQLKLEPKIKGLKDGEEASENTQEPKVTEYKKPEEKKPTEEMSDELVLNKPLEMGVWEYPPVSLLSNHYDKKADRGDVKKMAATIEETLNSFGIQSRVSEINLGPSVTQYAIEIARGTKLSKITSLANDLALASEAPTGQVRIEAPIPGRNLVGIEIPNKNLEIVSLKTMLASKQMSDNNSRLAIPLGLDVSGTPITADISKMPHTLIAGTTGSGKSVLVNSIISSLLFRNSPSEVKLILIDPKRVELTGYNDIPHLLTPVVVEADKSVSSLKWAMKEMDRRYVRFSEAGVRNIDSYNELAGFQALPYIVVVIDEFADLMTVAPVEVEDSITRLAQMARATGIHLVLATQRPSVDVITGLIKANIPARIAFNVSSGVDSKVVLDAPGAEKLLGRGDMLYIPPDQAKPMRIQGAFVSEQDTKRLVNFIKARGIPVNYTEEVTQQQVSLKKGMSSSSGLGGGGGDKDELFEDAIKVVIQNEKASSSLLQRRLSVGFNRAANILEQLEAEGIVGPPDGSKPREVLIRSFEEYSQKSNTSEQS